MINSTQENGSGNDMKAYNTIFRHTLGFLVSQAIYIVSRLDIADYLAAEGPKHINDIADKVDADKSYLGRILRLLANNEIFKEVDDDVYTLTELAELLISDHPKSIKNFAIMMNYTPVPFGSTLKLFDCVKTGGSVPFDEHYGMRPFDMVISKPEYISIFSNAMTSAHAMASKSFIESYDLTGTEAFADIGGGAGNAAKSVLQAYPDVKAILFDLPHVVQGAQPHFEEQGLIDRCEMVGGDFFESIPVKADVYFLRQVLHDWTDEQATNILKNLRISAPKGSKLLISDCIVRKKVISENIPYYDVSMLLYTGGRERTIDEFKALLDATGFEFSKVVETDFWFDTIEAFAV